MRLEIAFALLVLAACSPPTAQTAFAPGVEQNFMRACEAQSTVPGLCGCTWDRIEAGISPSDFAAVEALPGLERQGHPLTAQIESYALACGADVATDDEPSAP